MIDHFMLKVRDYQKSKQFYLAALKPLGYELVMEFGEGGGLGAGGKPDFWIGRDAAPTSPVHFAFHADQRRLVDAFYEAAIQAGGKDNGKPGLRPDYHPNYYGAFVIDPDGHNVEAVCHGAE
jgi:catechol 2,3-dioxygenase-like lactoylglutathione lyase family enzyme